MTFKRGIRSKRLAPSFSALAVFFICSTVAILFTSPHINLVTVACSQTKIKLREQANFQNETEGKKTGGIVGDPSRKRGFELGYDAGPRAESEDIAQNKNPDPALRPEYKKPEQFYRYEYGSRDAFIVGFRSGFRRGYMDAFGKMKLKRMEMARETVFVPFLPSRKARIESVSREPLPKKITLAEDAL